MNINTATAIKTKSVIRPTPAATASETKPKAEKPAMAISTTGERMHIETPHAVIGVVFSTLFRKSDASSRLTYLRLPPADTALSCTSSVPKLVSSISS